MNKLILRIFSALAFISLIGNVHGQADCTSPVAVTDLTGAVCATASPSNTSWLAAGSCEEGAFETWFSFVAQGPTATIDVSNSASGFRPEITVISSSDNTCGGVLTEEDCTDQNGNYTAISTNLTGLTTGDTYWIAVSSNGDRTNGTTTVCVTNPVASVGCLDNEECVDAEVLTLNASGGAAVCDTDCNTGASAGNTYTGPPVCQDQPNATVWYEFTTAADAATVDISLTSPDLSDPEFALIQGNACVGPWTTIACNEGAAGSSTLTGITVTPNTTYVIGVSDATGDEGDFTICVNQNVDNSACNTNNTLTVTNTSLGSPAGGPYQQGEQVTFCYNLTDWTQINCNYIGAFVPTFGDGWLPASFDAQGMPVTINTPLNVVGVIQPAGGGDPWAGCAGNASGAWNWFPAGSVTYNVNGYYPANTPMPGGWYFLSSYTPGVGTCAPDPTDPDDTYGDGDFPNCGVNTFDYTLCFTLTAGSQPECDAGTTDLTVSIKTFGDGEFGAWNNLGCTVDQPTTSATSIDCTLPIDLLSYEGQYNQNKTFLNWKTASEENVSHYIISYHSNFTNELTQLGTVKAKGFSNVELEYEFIHDAPHPGTSYYNLKAVDEDGKINDHGFIPVTANYEFISYRPDLKQIQMNYEGDIEIYSMDGALVKKSTGSLFIDFDLKGIFFVKDIKRGIFQKIVTH